MGSDTHDNPLYAASQPSARSAVPASDPSSTDASAQPGPAMSAALAAAFAEVARPWRVAPELSAADLAAITHAVGITNLQAQLLDNRGIHGAAAARAFLKGDWRGRGATLPNLDAAVARLRAAIAAGERIVVFGDYDSDGMTSCATLLLALRALGAHAEACIPRRDDDGRGLNLDAIEQLARQGAQLIVTTDCGSANVAEVARAHELGMDVIVTDHHPPYGERPDCLIVNPQLDHAASLTPDADGATRDSALDAHSDLADLSGAGVGFHLAEALLSMPGADANATLESLLDLVVIGTIGDVVPLTPHNWALAHAGLERLRMRPRTGLRALLASANIAPGQATERDIAFAIAPRLNAAARLGEPMTALNLLITDDDVAAIQLAARLETLNQERQRLTDQIIDEAREQASRQVGQQVGRPSLIFVQGENWPLGIIGLVAGRLVDEYGCAAVTLSCAGDECRGSARGPVGVNLVGALAERPGFFRRFGGHARAAGFTIARADVAALREHLTQRLATPGTTISAAENAGEHAEQDDGGARVSTSEEPLMVDCRLPLDRVNLQRYADIRRLAPFGVSFPEPRFVCRGARVMRCWRSGSEGRNLRLALRASGEERVFLWSRQGAICEELRTAIPRLPAYDVVYTFDAFQRADGETQLIARIVALRPTEPR